MNAEYAAEASVRAALRTGRHVVFGWAHGQQITPANLAAAVRNCTHAVRELDDIIAGAEQLPEFTAQETIALRTALNADAAAGADGLVFRRTMSYLARLLDLIDLLRGPEPAAATPRM